MSAPDNQQGFATKSVSSPRWQLLILPRRDESSSSPSVPQGEGEKPETFATKPEKAEVGDYTKNTPGDHAKPSVPDAGRATGH